MVYAIILWGDILQIGVSMNGGVRGDRWAPFHRAVPALHCGQLRLPLPAVRWGEPHSYGTPPVAISEPSPTQKSLRLLLLPLPTQPTMWHPCQGFPSAPITLHPSKLPSEIPPPKGKKKAGPNKTVVHLGGDDFARAEGLHLKSRSKIPPYACPKQ